LVQTFPQCGDFHFRSLKTRQRFIPIRPRLPKSASNRLISIFRISGSSLIPMLASLGPTKSVAHPLSGVEAIPRGDFPIAQTALSAGRVMA
jgi:hypothetical protein